MAFIFILAFVLSACGEDQSAGNDNSASNANNSVFNQNSNDNQQETEKEAEEATEAIKADSEDTVYSFSNGYDESVEVGTPTTLQKSNDHARNVLD